MARFVAVTIAIAVLAPAAARADAAAGERVFQRCAACHSVAASDAAKLPGPNLKTVIGRRAGTLPGFEYSTAMVDAGKTDNITWTRATLDKYLADPDDVVPGTAMRLNFQLTPDDRANVIDFLEQAAKK